MLAISGSHYDEAQKRQSYRPEILAIRIQLLPAVDSRSRATCPKVNDADQAMAV